MPIRTVLSAVLFVATPLAHADVQHAAADTMTITHRFTLAGTSPQRAWDALLHPGRWWPSAHTWSGDAKHLSLEAKAGGCFCETWPGGSVEHGRVIMAKRDELLRLDAPLGPLQEMSLAGLLQVKLAAQGDDTIADVTFRASGDSGHQLEQLAPVVDRVLGEQFGRFADYAPDGRIAPAAPAE